MGARFMSSYRPTHREKRQIRFENLTDPLKIKRLQERFQSNYA
jgi:hypothetical protein